MTNQTIKVRAKAKKGVAKVKCLISHPMETGLRTDSKTGTKVAARYIQEVVCDHKGKNVMTAHWSTGISKNPYLSFKVKDANKGDTLTLSWSENIGKKDSITVTVN